MSSYQKKIKHPITGKKQIALCVDNYYSHHEYGYGFKKDGTDADMFTTRLDECDFFPQENLTNN